MKKELAKASEEGPEMKTNLTMSYPAAKWWLKERESL